MAQNNGPLKQAWSSPIARKATWVLMIATFALMVALGSYLRLQEQQQYRDTIIKSAHLLAATVLSGGNDSGDILLKVNDLLNVDAVLGVKLQEGRDVPLSVGQTPSNFPPADTLEKQTIQWLNNQQEMDIALRLDAQLPFDWLVLRLNASRLAPSPMWGTLVNWVGAPLIAVLLGLVSLWLWGRSFLKPLNAIQQHLQDNAGKLASTALAQELTTGKGEPALLAQQIEAMRVEVNDAKTKADAQARFLHETPYALLRCSVNRKVLYANSAARALKALFGNDDQEFIAPALAELVRKAFYEAKPVFGDIRSKNTIITFRAVPVLEAGYVNLYGESKRNPLDEF